MIKLHQVKFGKHNGVEARLLHAPKKFGISPAVRDHLIFHLRTAGFHFARQRCRRSNFQMQTRLARQYRKRFELCRIFPYQSNRKFRFSNHRLHPGISCCWKMTAFVLRLPVTSAARRIASGGRSMSVLGCNDLKGFRIND